jgi:3-oxoacyl-[acyl-carrier protein] reductase
MDEAVKKFGQINAVFANAGIIKDGLMVNTDKEGKVKSVMSTDDFQKVINVNLTGTFITLREGAKRMIENKWKGVLIITTSINKVGQVGQINYASTKAAVAMWPKLISAEFHMKGIKNIRTASIAPGYTATPILNGMNQDALAAILKDVHIDRLVEPDEIFKAVRFIIDNEAVDGTCIEVTGGVTYGPRAMVK